MMTMNFLFVLFSLISTTLTINYQDSCINLDDGAHTLKFLDGDDYPPINVKCSNEYVVLDYNYDNDLKTYFSSWHQWYPNFVGTLNTDHSNWQKWFLPYSEDEKAKFILSQDCSTCDESTPYQLFGSQTGYYMSGTIYGCGWFRFGTHDCDFRYSEELEASVCHSCSGSSTVYSTPLGSEATASEYYNTGICPILIQNSSGLHPSDHLFGCTAINLGDTETAVGVGKPSLGIAGEFCVCAKPSDDTITFYESSIIKNTDSDNNIKIEDENDEEIVEITLHQSDFDKGPYRITKPGTYIIGEDIEFNFNSVEYSENSIESVLDDNAWWPIKDQSDDYPGAGMSYGPFWAGFFAGITIETDNVILDLNDKELKMNYVFFLQQRWFTHIELSTQYFNPGEGPLNNFGGDPIYANNVKIMNGKLGLSSHHAIHGNYNSDITLIDLDIYNFETHGIQLNGFSDVILENIKIHDTVKNSYFSGEYAQMKAILPVFHTALETSEYADTEFYIKNREESTTYREIVEDIEMKMKLVFNYVVFNIEPTIGIDCTQEEWEDALHTYYNEYGYPYGSSLYGIFLNTFGASVAMYKLNVDLVSMNAKLNNIEIYNLNHNMKEYVLMGPEIQKIWITYYQSGYNAPDVIGQDFIDNYDYRNDTGELDYIGNSFIDSLFLLSYVVDDTRWDLLGEGNALYNSIMDWSRTGDDKKKYEDDEEMGILNFKFFCNTDVMRHPGKGISGIRIDGVNDIELKNIEIHDIYSHTGLGSAACGPYGFDAYTAGGTFNFRYPMQKGFAANNVHGISVVASKNVKLDTIEIYNLESQNGLVYGLALWPNTRSILKGDISVYNLNAGTELEKGTYKFNDSPNSAPDACAILLYTPFTLYTSTVNTKDVTSFSIHDINGHVGCLGRDETTMVGSIPNSGSDENKHSKSKIHKSSKFSYFQKNPIYIKLFACLIVLGVFITIIMTYVFYLRSVKNIIKNHQSNHYGTFDVAVLGIN